MALRDLLYRSSLYHLALRGPAPAEPLLRLPETWPGDSAAGQALLDKPAQWTAENHRFAWLADLASLGGERAITQARDYAGDWLARCDNIEPVGWSAVALGDRLFAIVAHDDLLTAPPRDEAFRRALAMSLGRQLRHLFRIWRQATGFDRLAALRGLVVAGAAQGDARRLKAAVGFLAGEIKVQILPDGGHISRSPAMLLTALQCLIDVRDALRASGGAVPAWLAEAIEKSAPLLRFFRHGDGGLALFNGANEGDRVLIDLVLQRAESKSRPPSSATYAGFERLQAGRSLAMIDCGAPPAPPFDGDAHAGSLAFELSHGKERLIVNCGAYHGDDASWRNAMRATAAHSTLIVAETNSAEIGPDGHFATKPRNVTQSRNERDGNQYVSCGHDGYARGFGLRHEREIYLSADGEDLRGEDRLTGAAGTTLKTGGFVIRFHLHPDVQASTTQEGNAVLLKLPGGSFFRLKVAGAVVNLAESVYLGDGRLRKTKQVVLESHVGSGGAAVKWALKREARKGEAAET